MLDELIRKHPELSENGMEFYEMTREEKFEFMWKRIHRLMQVKKELFTENSKKAHTWSWSNMFASYPSPINLHQSMFTTSIKMLASDEQKK